MDANVTEADGEHAEHEKTRKTRKRKSESGGWAGALADADANIPAYVRTRVPAYFCYDLA